MVGWKWEKKKKKKKKKGGCMPFHSNQDLITVHLIMPAVPCLGEAWKLILILIYKNLNLFIYVLFVYWI